MSSKDGRRRKKKKRAEALGSARGETIKKEYVSANDVQAKEFREAQREIANRTLREWNCPKCTYKNGENTKRCKMCGFDFDDKGSQAHPLEEPPYGFEKVGKKKKRRNPNPNQSPSSHQNPNPSYSSPHSASLSDQQGRRRLKGGGGSGSGGGRKNESQVRHQQQQQQQFDARSASGQSEGSIGTPHSFASGRNPSLYEENVGSAVGSDSPYRNHSVPTLEPGDLPDLERRGNQMPLLGSSNGYNGPVEYEAVVHQRPQNQLGHQKTELMPADHICNTYKVNRCAYNSIDDCNSNYFCEFYHNMQERRRSPLNHFYLPEACPHIYRPETNSWANFDLCPNGDACGFSHTDVEQYYHYLNYKITKCEHYVEGSPTSCGWERKCSYAHGLSDLRTPNRQEFINFYEAKNGASLSGGNHSLNPNPNPPTDLPPLESNANNMNATNTTTTASNGVYHASNGNLAAGLSADLAALNLDVYSDGGGGTGVHGGGTGVGGGGTAVVGGVDGDVVELQRQLQYLQEEHVKLTELVRAQHKDHFDEIMQAISNMDGEEERKRSQELQALKREVQNEQAQNDELHMKIQCPHCYARYRDCAVRPCGHVFCQQCVNNNQSRVCMVCGQGYNKIQVLEM